MLFGNLDCALAVLQEEVADTVRPQHYRPYDTVFRGRLPQVPVANIHGVLADVTNTNGGAE
jgi:hypothetical protein